VKTLSQLLHLLTWVQVVTVCGQYLACCC
jgi:hypothetical protein